ncbi:MAG: UPF0104 family protein [Verrucomicrobia bacterium]|nr:UPF0104 family protein [Verrucomicrobiota bacterium]
MVEPKPAPTLLGRLAPWIRLAVTAGILGFLAGRVDFAQLGQWFLSANPVWLTGALLLTLVSILLCGLRFWLLLRLQKIFLPLLRSLYLTLVGFFFSLFLIGSTGGDAIRLYYLIRWFPEQKARWPCCLASPSCFFRPPLPAWPRTRPLRHSPGPSLGWAPREPFFSSSPLSCPAYFPDSLCPPGFPAET